MSAASCAVHRPCRWTRSPGSKRSPGAEINEAKKVLATEATALLHGREAAERAAETARKTFEQGALAESLPTVEIAARLLDAGLGVLTAFGPEYAKLVPSTGEARRQVKSGGLRVNDQAVTDERGVLRPARSDAGGRHQALLRQEAARPAARRLSRRRAADRSA